MLFLRLPMPEKYKCVKEINYLFKNLRGSITEQNCKLKETAHKYMVEQAMEDFEKYRASLPAEAVHEICYCLKEKAGLRKYKPEQYDWGKFLKDMRSAQMLYMENELLADAALCALHIIDEALAEPKIDANFKPLHVDAMKSALQEVEEILPELMEHPILNEIYLRLAHYCLVMNDIQKGREYYEKLQKLGKFSIDHFAPWLRKKILYCKYIYAG